MNLRRLVTRSLLFYWRTNAAVLAAVIVATGVLTGALAVGDCVRHTLDGILHARLGEVEFAASPHGRYFRAGLAGDLQRDVGGDIAGVLRVSGMIADDDGSHRVNQVQVLGVDEGFYALGSGTNPFGETTDEGVVLSEAVAKQLDVASGGEVLLRIERVTTMPRDVPLVSDEDRTVAFRLKVLAVADEAAFARFDLAANQAAPLNVFVPRNWLAEKMEQPGRINLLLAARLKPGCSLSELNGAVRKAWQPADAGIELEHLDERNTLELRSRRIFIEESLGDEAMKADPCALGVLTYFVNEIRLGDKATPYSMVAALDAGCRDLVPAGMHADEIVINQWLADDLGARVGDSIDLVYYVMGVARTLREERGWFKVVKIMPLEGAAADPSLMPAFPGLADVDNCRDWEPGIPVDLDRIRPKDEQYWDEHRGTPKAFITLEAGQSRWGNRYGNLTAIRYPWRAGLDGQVARYLMSAVDPATVGLFFQPVRARGQQAGRGGTDFGQLFLGLSMFLIGSAIILIGLLFVFGIESRSQQIGLLLAVGWPVRRVKQLLLAEGGIIALAGTILGVAAGLLYTRLMLFGLSTFWSGAVADAQIRFHATTLTLFVGGLGGLIAALFAVWVTLRKQGRLPARELLAGNEEHLSAVASRARGRLGILVTVIAFAGAAVLVFVMPAGDSETMAGMFFGAAALLLLGTLGLNHAVLSIAAGGWDRPLVSLQGLGLRNAARRRGRSLGIIGLLACGVFMVVAVGANRREPPRGPQRRDSGTGGFALYGESSIGILYDLNSRSGRKSLGLTDPQLDGLEAVQLRLYEGDDASCLNLNRAQRPRLLAARPEALESRGAFQFTSQMPEAEGVKGWDLLGMDLENDVVPAVGDYPTVFWALGKSIGDEVEYIDEMGKSFRVRIVGMLASSILQGSLVIAEKEFVTRFPSVDGYRVLLIDASADKMASVAQRLSSGLTDCGLVLTPARERLAAFGAVESTYLSIFTALGGLGLALGSIGLGLVVLRNMLQRRGELAMLRAVGFERARIRRMVFYEHWGLMLAGLVCGGVSAVVAVLPALQSPGAEVPYVSLLATIAAIAVSGAAWVWLAGTLALRGPLLDALRQE